MAANWSTFGKCRLNSFNKIGRRYLDIKGGYITIEELNANLNSRIYNDVEIDKYNGLNTRQKKTIISKIIKKDFESGNIIDVDGWVLSNTEVNICAILCLVKSHSES